MYGVGERGAAVEVGRSLCECETDESAFMDHNQVLTPQWNSGKRTELFALICTCMQYVKVNGLVRRGGEGMQQLSSRDCDKWLSMTLTMKEGFFFFPHRMERDRKMEGK